MRVPQEIKHEIERALARQRISQRGLARNLEIQITYLNRVLNGHQEITARNLNRLIESLGLEVECHYEIHSQV